MDTLIHTSFWGQNECFIDYLSLCRNKIYDHPNYFCGGGWNENAHSRCECACNKVSLLKNSSIILDAYKI
jgi:hypothetical protein